MSTGCLNRSSKSMKRNASGGWKLEIACAPYVFERCWPDASGSTSIQPPPRLVIRWGGIFSPFLCGIRVPVVRPTNWSECSVSYESWEKPCGQARLRCSLPPIARLGGCGYLSRPHPMGSLRRYGSFSLQQQDSPSVAIGSPAAGIKGFRRSHAQAVAIRSVVLARKDKKQTVVADSDPGLAAPLLVGG